MTCWASLVLVPTFIILHIIATNLRVKAKGLMQIHGLSKVCVQMYLASLPNVTMQRGQHAAWSAWTTCQSIVYTILALSPQSQKTRRTDRKFQHCYIK